MTEFSQLTETGTLMPADAVEAAAPQSAGQMLRSLRESAGVDAAVLASAMKVSLQKLQALESDRIDLLPDVSFARGLAASICRAFGVDPAPVLERMPKAALELNPLKPALNTPLRRSSGQSVAATWSRNLPRWLLVVVGLLLLGSVALWLWPTLAERLGMPVPEQQELVLPPVEPDGEQSAPFVPGLQPMAPLPAVPLLEQPVEEPRQPAIDPEPGPAQASDTLADAGTDARAGLPGTTDPAASEQAQALIEQPVPDRAAEAPAVEEQVAQVVETVQQPLAQSLQAALLELVAQGESWVSVHDAAGATLLNRTLEAGETVSLDGREPLSVVIGRKGEVQVRVRGEDFDHLVLGRAEVARFQVQ